MTLSTASRRRARSLMAGGAMFALLISVASVNGAPIPLVNQSFELPGVYTHGSNPASVNNERWTIVNPPGWTLTLNGSGPLFSVGVADPAEPLYSGTGANNVQGLLSGTATGFAYGYMNVQPGLASALNYTGSSLGSVTANTLYSLTVAVGQRKDGFAPSYTVQLLDGSSVLASASRLAITDTFVDLTVTYTSLTSGGPLGIRIIATNSAFEARQANFDNVRLNADPIPAPAGAAVLLIGLTSASRRRRG